MINTVSIPSFNTFNKQIKIKKDNLYNYAFEVELQYKRKAIGSGFIKNPTLGLEIIRYKKDEKIELHTFDQIISQNYYIFGAVFSKFIINDAVNKKIKIEIKKNNNNFKFFQLNIPKNIKKIKNYLKKNNYKFRNNEIITTGKCYNSILINNNDKIIIKINNKKIFSIYRE